MEVVSETVNRFAVDLVRATRPHDHNAPDVVRRYVQYGASVRATMYLTLAAKARALMSGRYHVTHDDISALDFNMVGTIDEAVEKAQAMAAEAA